MYRPVHIQVYIARSADGHFSLLSFEARSLDVARSADGVFLFVGAACEGHVAAARDGYFEFFHVEGAFEIARATAVELKRIAFDGGSDFDIRRAAVADLADAAAE